MAKFVKMNMEDFYNFLDSVTNNDEKIEDVEIVINGVQVWGDYARWDRYVDGSIKMEFIEACDNHGNDYYIDDDDNWQWTEDICDYYEDNVIASIVFNTEDIVEVKKLKTKLVINKLK